MVGGRVGCSGRGRCMGMGMGGGCVGVLLIVTVLASFLGVGGSMVCSVGVMEGLDVTRLGMGGIACIGWHSGWYNGGRFLPDLKSVAGV